MSQPAVLRFWRGPKPGAALETCRTTRTTQAASSGAPTLDAGRIWLLTMAATAMRSRRTARRGRAGWMPWSARGAFGRFRIERCHDECAGSGNAEIASLNRCKSGDVAPAVRSSYATLFIVGSHRSARSVLSQFVCAPGRLSQVRWHRPRTRGARPSTYSSYWFLQETDRSLSFVN